MSKRSKKSKKNQKAKKNALAKKSFQSTNKVQSVIESQSKESAQSKKPVQSHESSQSKSIFQSKSKSQRRANSQGKTKSDPWEKDFLKEVEQAERAAEVAEFDEADLLVALPEEHAPEVVAEVEGGGTIVELGNKNLTDEEMGREDVVEEASDLKKAEEVVEPELEEQPEDDYNAAADLASDDDLKLLAETGVVQRKPSLLHRINVRLPWLKVILLVASIAILAVVVGRLVESLIVGKGASGGDTPVAVLGDQDSKSEELQPSEEIGETVESEPAEKAIPEAIIPEGGTKLVALTFDDGPSGATTWRLLDILAEKQVRVTFFVLGNMVLNAPDLLRAELAAGHEVGSHTVTHANLAKSAPASIQWEVQRMNEIFQEVTGAGGPILLRPPYGAVNDTVRAQVGQPMILWTVDTEDWRYRNPAEVRRRALAGVFDGAIILMHDIHATTIDAVAGIIDDLKAAGYTIVTVSQLAAARGATLQNGWTYGSFRP